MLEILRSLLLFPEDTAIGSSVEDFVAVVRGGSSESITGLVSKKLPTPQLMTLWGEGVRYNPDFIRKTVSFSIASGRRPNVYWLPVRPILMNTISQDLLERIS